MNQIWLELSPANPLGRLTVLFLGLCSSLCEIKKKERKKTFKSREVFFSSASGVWGYRHLAPLFLSLW